MLSILSQSTNLTGSPKFSKSSIYNHSNFSQTNIELTDVSFEFNLQNLVQLILLNLLYYV